MTYALAGSDPFADVFGGDALGSDKNFEDNPQDAHESSWERRRCSSIEEHTS